MHCTMERSYAVHSRFPGGQPQQTMSPTLNHWHTARDAGFEQRLFAWQYYFSSSIGTEEGRVGSPEASSGSVVVTNTEIPPESAALPTYPPSLCSVSTATSRSSISTDRADSFLQSLLENDEAVDSQQPETRLPCCYAFLSCTYSGPLDEWDRHCQSHWRGQLPRTVCCPFDCPWVSTDGEGARAWKSRLTHISRVHKRSTEVMSDGRRDPALLRQLWNARIITDAELQEIREKGKLMQVPAAGSERPAAYLVTARPHDRKRK